jgi:hypothetical protein
LQQQVDAGLVVHARVEPDVAEHRLGQRWQLHVLGDAPEAAPVVGDRATAVRDDQTQLGEPQEDVGHHQLGERGRVGAEIVRRRGVEVRIARRADVDHRRNVELDERLVERSPVGVTERRAGPGAPARVWIDVAPDEAHLLDAPPELGDGWPDGRPG